MKDRRVFDGRKNMYKSKSKFGLLMLLGATSLSLAACGHSKSAQSKPDKFQQAVPKKTIKDGGTLTEPIVVETPFTGIFLDELSDTAPDGEAVAPGDETLFSEDEHLAINDKGAATLRLNQKNRSATIRVKDKVRWSDGVPVTAKDLVYSYEIIANAKSQSTQYGSTYEKIVGMKEYHDGKAKTISGLEMPDGPKGKTLVIHFKEMKPGMKQSGSHYIWENAAPYHYLKNVPFEKLISSDKVRKNPLFFGPYKMVKTVRGQSTYWSRNPYYWRGKPHFDHVNLSTISSSNVTQAIKSHKFDVAEVPLSQYQEVKNSSATNFIGDKELAYNYVGFRVGRWDKKLGKNIQDKHAKMNNVNLRKAMLYAMNVEAVNQKFTHGLTFKVNTLVPKIFGDFHDSSIPGYGYNLKKANQLLDEAGYKKDGTYRRQPNGKKLTIHLAVRAGNSNTEPIWRNYIQQWNKVGLDVRFINGRPMEFNSWVQAIKDSDPRIDVFEGGWGLSGEPSQSHLYDENSPFNFARFVSPTNTKLLNEINSQKSFNHAYRVKKFHEWQRWMYDNAYLVPTSNSYSVTAVSDKVSGWSLKPSANNWYNAGFVK